MAANSDGHTKLTTVVICEGDLLDPRFPAQLEIVLDQLNGILGDTVKIRKLEPWNSVRVTLSIPREAALRLRQLANEGSNQLRALGILSVQVDGDHVISLRLAGSVNSEPQEIILRTSQDGSGSSSTDSDLATFLAPPAPAAAPAASTAPASSQVQFKSPNVVCPADSVVPKAAAATSNGGTKSYSSGAAGPFPFTSMNQAIHATSMPPPYPGKHPPVTISSPLLVNLLQNDGGAVKDGPGKGRAQPPLQHSQQQGVFIKKPEPVSKPHAAQASSATAISSTAGVKSSNSSNLHHQSTFSQATNLLMNNSISSPSALSTTNTSIRQNSSSTNSTVMTSTSGKGATMLKSPPPQPPPPQYRVASGPAMAATSMIKQHQPATGYQNINSTSTTSYPQSSSVFSQSPLPVSQSNALPQLSSLQTNVYQSPSVKSPLTPPTGNYSLPHQQIMTDQSGNFVQHSKNNPFSQQKNVALPQAKTPVLPANIPLGKSPNVGLYQQKSTIGNLPQSASHMKTSLQSKSTNYIPQQVPMKNSSNYSRPPISNMSLTNSNSMMTNSNSMMTSSNAMTTNSNSMMTNSNSMLTNSNSMMTNSNSMMTNSNSMMTNSTTNMTNSNLTVPQSTLTSSMATTSLSNTSDSLNSNTSSLSNAMLRSLPSPPPYSVAISRPWDSLVHSNALMDLTPSLTDLKADDLDELLPSLERELTHSPLPELPEDFLAAHSNLMAAAEQVTQQAAEDKRKFLINPLTGELEPQSSGESETEDLKDVFTGLPSPAALSDEDTCSTTRPDTNTDQSDSETRSSDTTKPPRLKNSKGTRERGRDSPALKQEKIKLRLKLEKSEPVNPAYKVDVSFINTQPKKASSSVLTVPGTTSEELRVPPLHISLRGRNSVVIKNKTKLNPDGTPIKPKIRKNPDGSKMKKGEGEESLGSPLSAEIEELKKASSMVEKKVKKFKAGHEHKDIIATISQESELKSKFLIHNHYKEKQKERRGSDSELVRNNKKYVDSNGILLDERKRRLSQAEQSDETPPQVLGSTNVGTIAGLPQKPRKDKVKVRDVFKKDAARNKMFGKSLGEKLLQSKQVSLPTAGDMNMEAKFKQGLMEGTVDKGVVRLPHRTEVVNHLITENNRVETSEKAPKTISETTTSPKEKSPEPDKCNTPDRKTTTTTTVELTEKAVTTVTGGGAGRSPTSGGGQGEDSGIESMDALSEKSPNQASQSPHADILPPKTQVPNMLDIEAQLAKMEGLNGDGDHRAEDSTSVAPAEVVPEDENDESLKHKQCCELKCVLQDSLGKGPMTQKVKEKGDVGLVPHKVKKEEEDLEPLPVRVTPALYTYSNPDKSRAGSESPNGLSDEDSNSCSTSSTLQSKPSKSLLEQLLIEIPNDHQSVPSSPSPATRSSVRTRALSKLGSPELSSPVPKNTRAPHPPSGNVTNRIARTTVLKTLKEVSHQATPGCCPPPPGACQDEAKRCNCEGNRSEKSAAKVPLEESSDSDEPLIEKVRKPNNAVGGVHGTTARTKVRSGSGNVANNNKTVVVAAAATIATPVAVNTRRSVRSNMPALNTRSKGDKVQSAESEALRRKTRSAVLDVDSKRKKEVK